MKQAMDHSKILFFFLYRFSLLLFFSSQVTADLLNSDKQALLAFASALHHGKKLNWNSTTPICSSWIGVKCSMDQARVQAIRLPGMGLFGSIPSNTLAKLDALQILSLRSNRLVGNLPTDISSLPSLRHLYLQENNFSGNLPKLFSSRLTVLDLSYNSFTGGIPDVFQNLSQLSVLFLQNNSLSGSIPDFKLVGLQRLNLSYNELNGSIPSSLQKFPNESFTGNSLLCGPPLAQCAAVLPSPPVLPPISNPEDFHPKHKHSSIGTWAIIAIVAGVLSVLLLLVMVIVVCVMKKNGREGSGASKKKSSGSKRSEKPKEESSSGAQNADKNKLSFFEGCSNDFDLDDLLRASAEILGKGTYGTSYKAILEDGTMVVVKRLKAVVSGKREFEQQMEIIRRLGEHRNVLSIRAYYYSKEEKLLVYDFIPYGSFSSLLHGNRGSNRTSLDWDSRVKILLGVAHGIEHIHTEGGGQFVHGNLKSSNVLVSQNFEACVSDFCLSSIMNTPVNHSRIAVGYHPPEVIEMQRPTQKSDIYSFGVLLLEMLTGKSPLQSQGADDIVDLPRWVQSMVREEWTSEVFDAELLRYPNIEEEMVQMLQFALACVANNPERRPNIDNVISMIEEIWQPSSGNRSSSEEKSVRITA